MNKLLKKELALAMHPTAPMFLALSVLLIIPNYPYYVTFFYTSLAIFFTCLNGRENNDVYYTLLLPVPKRSVVASRMLFAVLLELAQLLLALPFALIRQSMPIPGNQAGMDANIAFFGLALVLLGIFNAVFFPLYYRDVTKVGKAFAIASAVEFMCIIAAEACAFALPFFKTRLDTPDPQYLGSKLAVLFAGLAVYLLLTALSYRSSARSFEKLDI